MKARMIAELDPVAEIEGVRVGDRRLDGRAATLMKALARSPGQSLPVATGGGAALEGAYRFLRNVRVTLGKLLEPHIEATVARARAASSVIVAHDTTEFRFGGDVEREGLGEVACQGQGFFGHVALAITEERHPLGVLGVSIVSRERGRPRGTKKIGYLKRSSSGESARWRELLEAVQTRVGDALPIHVMDQEAEEYTLLAEMVEIGCRFVVRMNKARKRRANFVDGLDVGHAYVADAVHSLRGIAEREVVLAARSTRRVTGSRRDHPARDRRVARLRFVAATMEIAPPRDFRATLRPLTLNVIHVIEVNAPDGEEPVEWILYTNEPITTTTDVLAAVDAYRARWVIEEYFKVLKTGCAIERRQLESQAALLNCLGLYVPIAVKMLALRTRARLDPDTPAAQILSSTELQALRLIARSRLPQLLTAQQALLAIAAVGGHLPNNGFPGWLTIARGFETLRVAVQVVEAHARSDQ
jgi:hypothetical protein